jgi:formylmethanofuran dehydrogenase subunit E
MDEVPVFDLEEYLRLVQSFHGHVAPGVVVGGFMVHLARARIPEGVLFDAICETPACLPDAIQLLTPCTVGNGWVKIINLGRFALSLYDKDQGNGFRVFLDPKKLDNWSEIKTWFFKLRPKAEQNMELLLAQIKEAGGTLCGINPIRVRPELLKKQKRGEIVICPCCREAFPARDGEVCRGCQGESPYIVQETSDGNLLALSTLKSYGVY